MISIHCRTLMQILCDIRRSLGIRKNDQHPVTIQADREATIVRVTTKDASIACQIPGGSNRPESVVLSMQTLTGLKCPPKRDISLCTAASRITLSWWHEGQEVFETTDSLASVEEPGHEPEWLISNHRQLGKSLQQAASLTDPDSSRYALGCIQLRGRDGQISATDGRQAFTHSGFSFPVDDVLVSAAPLKQLKCLERCSSISIGRSNDWLSLRMAVGPLRWLVDLKIFSGGRFPNVDQCMPHVGSARCTLTIGDSDAAYIQKHLGRLIGKSAEIQPLTIDLSKDRVSDHRTVQLRFTSQAELADVPLSVAEQLPQGNDGSRKTMEISLDSSDHDSLPLRVVLDYRYLLQALQLGFREIRFSSETSPIFCIDNQRRYVCAALHPSQAQDSATHAIVLSTSRQLAAA